jgi:hypothetical protein
MLASIPYVSLRPKEREDLGFKSCSCLHAKRYQHQNWNGDVGSRGVMLLSSGGLNGDSFPLLVTNLPSSNVEQPTRKDINKKTMINRVTLLLR